MKFSTKLFGYHKKQVERFLTETQSRYEQTLAGQQERITSLREENARLKEDAQRFREAEDQISAALIGANTRAESIIQESVRDAQILKKNMDRELEQNQILSRKINLEMETALQQALEITRIYTDDLNKIRQRIER